MTTTKPPAPAWMYDFSVPRWRDECDAPWSVEPWMLVEPSIHSHKLPESDALCERNDSEPEPEVSSSTTRKLEQDPTGEDVWPLERAQSGCESTAQMAESQIDAVETHMGTAPEGPREHPAWVLNSMDAMLDEAIRVDPAPETTAPADSCVAKCPVCLHEMENDEGVLCDHCGEPTGPGSFAVINGPGGVFVYHLRCYDEVYWGGCGGPRQEAADALMAEGYRDPEVCPTRETAPDEETPDVPFAVQEWLFESLAEHELGKLHDLIDDHAKLILEMARDRFRKGFAKYGSAMYSWSPERRLDETLQELADAVVYPTSGPLG